MKIFRKAYRFNSMIVRLKASPVAGRTVELRGFNSMIVRLKERGCSPRV